MSLLCQHSQSGTKSDAHSAAVDVIYMHAQAPSAPGEANFVAATRRQPRPGQERAVAGILTADVPAQLQGV
jgi:hypothetical protein